MATSQVEAHSHARTSTLPSHQRSRQVCQDRFPAAGDALDAIVLQAKGWVAKPQNVHLKPATLAQAMRMCHEFSPQSPTCSLGGGGGQRAEDAKAMDRLITLEPYVL